MEAASQSQPGPASEGRRQSDAPLFWAIGIVLAIVLVAGIVIYHSRSQTREAKAKATRLAGAYERAGLPVPSDLGAVAAVLGTDGGPVCENPTDPLVQAALNLNLTNGAATVGIRPVIVDRIALQGEEVILRVYCPQQLPGFREYVEENQFDNVVGR